MYKNPVLTPVQKIVTVFQIRTRVEKIEVAISQCESYKSIWRKMSLQKIVDSEAFCRIVSQLWLQCSEFHPPLHPLEELLSLPSAFDYYGAHGDGKEKKKGKRKKKKQERTREIYFFRNFPEYFSLFPSILKGNNLGWHVTSST